MPPTTATSTRCRVPERDFAVAVTCSRQTPASPAPTRASRLARRRRDRARWAHHGARQRGNGDLIPSLTGTFDFGFPLPLNHSSIWLRTGAASPAGDRDDPLANFYFGGFGNNYVDNGETASRSAIASSSSMPGFDIDALQRQVVGQGMLEWNLPPLALRGARLAGFLRQLGAARAVRERPRDRSRQQQLPAQCLRRRHAARLPAAASCIACR